MVDIPPDQMWMVVVGFIIAFLLAFGIGANDVANSFGTSVGSKVLNMRQACILASLFETLGAILLGAKVSDTIRKGIIDIEPYRNNTEELMLGNVAALSGSCIWLLAATLLRLPVSATHSIVGATVGFALVAHGSRGINWSKFSMIIGSWFVSPVLAGAISTVLFYMCKYFILTKDKPLEPGLQLLPIFYALTVVINLFSVFYDGPEMLKLDKIPLWGVFIISFGSGIICAILVRLVVVPWQRKKIETHIDEINSGTGKYEGPSSEETKDNQTKFKFNKTSDSCSYSANSSRKNSLGSNDSQEEKKNIIEMENWQNKQNTQNTHHKKEAACNLLPVPPAAPQPTQIMLPNTEIGKKNDKTPVKGKINKKEDAPLMDNEYKIGSVTPRKSSSLEDVSQPSEKDKEAMNGFTTPVIDKPSLNGYSNNHKEGIPIHFEGSASKKDVETGGPSGRLLVHDDPASKQLFSFLQILTAIFGAFAHGGNDVSNAIGPLVSLWLIGTTGVVSAKAATPIWVLFYGGAGISIGLWVWGRRVIKTLGEDLTRITPSSGFCIEIGSALTVLVASNIGIPISTTHCKVGSVVFVGRFRARENVDWSIFRNIVLAWLVTLPVSGGISAAIMAGFMKLL